jgi:hypothetical protein
MCAWRPTILLMILGALGGVTNCSQVHYAGREESTPPPYVTQEGLNSLLRQNRQETKSTPEIKTWAHKVRHHRETLFSIALWYTGSGENWPRLVEANPDLDPRRIHIGDTIQIPEDLLITRHPVPADFPKPKGRQPKARKSQPSSRIQAPAKNEETPLFGPIENELQPAGSEKKELSVPLEPLDQ